MTLLRLSLMRLAPSLHCQCIKEELEVKEEIRELNSADISGIGLDQKKETLDEWLMGDGSEHEWLMQGQRGWRELAILGDKINKFSGMIEGFIWSSRSGDSANKPDAWAFEEGPHSDFPGPNSGSTACVAVIRNKQLVIANAGDSRYVISRKGQAYNLSRDHKPDLGDMEFKQNKFLPTEKQIFTAIPDINNVELCDDDDFLVLSCDGIWDCMTSQQLVDFIHEKMNTETQLSVVCEKVLDRCLAPNTSGGEGCDNMILVQFKKPVQSTEPKPEPKPSQAEASHEEPSSSN